MKALMVAAMLAVGCTEAPSAPHVVPVSLAVDTLWADGAAVLPEYIAAAEAWSPLGFTFGDDAGLPECERDWWRTGLIDCQISVGIVRDPLLRERKGTNAMSDLAVDVVFIDSEMVGELDIFEAMAHEFGHVLLHDSTHTATGIMSGFSPVMTADDVALACAQVHICI